jgi:hypothetical protein
LRLFYQMIFVSSLRAIWYSSGDCHDCPITLGSCGVSMVRRFNDDMDVEDNTAHLSGLRKDERWMILSWRS